MFIYNLKYVRSRHLEADSHVSYMDIEGKSFASEMYLWSYALKLEKRKVFILLM